MSLQVHDDMCRSDCERNGACWCGKLRSIDDALWERLATTDICWTCDGSGFFTDEECSQCDGSGHVPEPTREIP